MRVAPERTEEPTWSVIAKPVVVVCGIALGVGVAMPVEAQRQRMQCGPSSNIALPDLTSSYRGLAPGLYPDGRTTPPPDHRAAGVDRAVNRVRPLDVQGRPAPDGRIILLSLGMSNTRSEFASFIADARQHPAVNRRLLVVNGSLSGADAQLWTDPDGPPWRHAIREVSTRRGLSPNQVQVIWIKQTHLRPTSFPQEIERLASSLESMLGIARRVFPNLQMVYLSSRTRAGAESRRGPGEPHAYETAFAVRRVIQAYLERAGSGGDEGPWIGWGPYLWSSGRPRSDGFVWDCGDVQRDMIHPTPSGNQKVANQLMSFFMAAETATPWFLEPSLVDDAATEAATAAPETGPVPLTVTFDGGPSPRRRYFWSFGDGTTSTEASSAEDVPCERSLPRAADGDRGRWVLVGAVVGDSSHESSLTVDPRKLFRQRPS